MFADADRPWVLYCGDKPVTAYRTREEAVDAINWYVGVYGMTRSELRVVHV